MRDARASPPFLKAPGDWPRSVPERNAPDAEPHSVNIAIL